MKWLILCLLFSSPAYADCTDMVVAQWRVNLSEKTISLVNFAPQSVKVCRDPQDPVTWILEVKKDNKQAIYPVELPQLPKGMDLYKSELDIYFQAPLPLWAKKSQLRLIQKNDQSVLATGEMK